MEKNIKIGFATWQIYVILEAIFIPLFVIFGFNPIAYGLTGFYFGCATILGVQHYGEWSIAKIKTKRKNQLSTLGK